MTALGIIGIIVGIGLLIYLAYKNFNLILCVPLICILIGLANRMDPIEVITENYMAGLMGMIKNMFFVFVLGSIFAEIYDKSGAALSISTVFYNAFTVKQRRNAKPGENIELKPAVGIGIVYIICIALAYGGIGALIITLVIMPVVIDIFKKCKLPREMVPGCVLGAIAAGVPSMPGTTSDQNVLASALLGTNAMVAPIIGFIGGIFVLLLNYMVMTYIGNKNIKKGNVFTESDEEVKSSSDDKTGPHWALAFVPMILMFITYNVLKQHIVTSLFLGIVLAILLFWKHINGFPGFYKLAVPAINQASMLSVIGGSLAGLGGVISAAPTFPVITSGLLNLGLPALYKASIAIMLVTGVAGGAPTGLSIALPIFKDTFTSMGIGLQELHRISVFSSQTLDTLPTNAALVMVSGIARTTLQKSYKYIFITTVLNTIIGALLVTTLFQIFG
jgi:H+/gluconate symporter-like permease